MSLDLAAYLARLGLSGPLRGAEGLARLQRAQHRALVFENIDPLTGQVPSLEIEAVAEKILHRGRGGYCFELNGLLGAALEGLGYDARPVLGRVRQGRAVAGPRGHLAWIVAAGGRRHLVDAGFGGPCPMTPLALDEAPQEVENGVFRLRPDPETGETVLERRQEAGWSALYGFDEAHVSQADLAAANHVCATWAAMPFPSHLFVNAYRDGARYGLFDRALSEERGGVVTRRSLEDPAALRALLCDRLGLSLEPALLAAIWERVAG